MVAQHCAEVLAGIRYNVCCAGPAAQVAVPAGRGQGPAAIPRQTSHAQGPRKEHRSMREPGGSAGKRLRAGDAAARGPRAEARRTAETLTRVLSSHTSRTCAPVAHWQLEAFGEERAHARAHSG